MIKKWINRDVPLKNNDKQERLLRYVKLNTLWSIQYVKTGFNVTWTRCFNIALGKKKLPKSRKGNI